MPLSAFSGRLPNRAIVRATGQDVTGFLQGLYCNDVRNLSPGGSVYGCFLNKSGRVLFDAILMQSTKTFEGNSAVYIDVDRSVAAFAVEHLKEFKLRRKIKLDDMSGKIAVVAAVGDNGGGDGDSGTSDGGASTAVLTESFADPRATFLSTQPNATVGAASAGDQRPPLRRVLLPAEWSSSPGSNPLAYDQLLLENGIYEGPNVFVKDKSLPFEANLDMLNGVSFHKGCYLGQELTHRTHVMLVTRKRTVPLCLGDVAGVPLDEATPTDAWGGNSAKVFTMAGQPVGVIQAARNNRAVGLLRLRYFDKTTRSLQVKLQNGSTAIATIPHWWDAETVDRILRGGDDDTKATQ